MCLSFFPQIRQTAINKDAEVWIDDFEIKHGSVCSPLGTCDFEKDICGYSYSRDGGFDWIRLNGLFGLLQNTWSVPTFDHTTNNSVGSFLYLESDNKENGDKAIIESEIISETAGAQCLQFYLKTNSVNKATLKVTLKNKINGAFTDVLSTAEASNGDFWLLKEVQLPQQTYPYSLLFQGIVGMNVAGQKGQLAIDDVVLFDRACGAVTIPTGSPSDSTVSGSTVEPVTFTSTPCPSDYCKNGGICTSINNNFKCRCPDKYTGEQCESLFKKNPDANSKIFGLRYFLDHITNVH